MTETLSRAAAATKWHWPNLPFVIWMVVLALALGFAGQLSASEVIAAFNRGFGWALGEFALILLPSFTLAAALARQNVASEGAGRASALAAPVAGAGMICPDTAYAALAPAAGRRKLDLAFGAYAGFKLLCPAGPLIVAAGLGLASTGNVEPTSLLVGGALLTLPVWGAGIAWARLNGGAQGAQDVPTAAQNGHLLWTFAPFVVMTGLLVLGSIVGPTGSGVVDFLLLPKGALMMAAVVALVQTPGQVRRNCLDSAVKRTGSLLLVIGAASAFGAILTGLVQLEQIVPAGSDVLTLAGLFGLTAMFKLAQGSSMATFAAAAPVAAPAVAASGADPVAAVFAICLGSFIAILPNDSYYWLVRRDALEQEESEARAIRILAGGAVVQAMVGMALLLAWVTLKP